MWKHFDKLKAVLKYKPSLSHIASLLRNGCVLWWNNISIKSLGKDVKNKWFSQKQDYILMQFSGAYGVSQRIGQYIYFSPCNSIFLNKENTIRRTDVFSLCNTFAVCPWQHKWLWKATLSMFSRITRVTVKLSPRRLHCKHGENEHSSTKILKL
jgi:hypothetical protein